MRVDDNIWAWIFVFGTASRTSVLVATSGPSCDYFRAVVEVYFGACCLGPI
jgi:hypothetical protein